MTHYLDGLRFHRRVESAAIFLSVLCWQNAMADFSPRAYQARYTSAPPTLDGQLTETIWTGAHTITDFYKYPSGGSPAASSTTARILWDEEFLYVGLELSDADIRPSVVTSGSGGRDGRLYEGDVIELFVRPQPELPQYFEFEWSANGDVFDARFDEVRLGAPGIDWNTEVTAVAHVEGTWDDASDQDLGWTVESRIPLSAFPISGPQADWRFAVARYDYFHPEHTSPQLMMSTPGDPDLPDAGLTSGFHTYEYYDQLTFVVPEPSGGTTLWLLMLLTLHRSHSAR